MKLNVDSYLARRFDLATQNCWHLARDAWLELTGVDLGDRTPETISAATLMQRFDSDVPVFEKLAKPVDPCLVLMRRPGLVPHVGVFYRGRILQMTRKRGACFEPLHHATAGFTDVGFYK